MNAITCEVPVFYATTAGQTRRIAERLAERLRHHGVDSRSFDVAGELVERLDWSAVKGAVVGASLHVRRYQSTAGQFVREHAAGLSAVPSAFFGVSLAAASSHADEVEAARRLAEAFPQAHGWTPALVVSLAGRLAYTKYNIVTRFLMKRIARKQGAPTDTSRDYEFTNWDRVERLARDVARLVVERRHSAPAA